ncbi:PepSY-associated TM helix domain-containing protein [Achromobacter xylosoxidans]|uniref:PepSY domain-containing protein n=1 Tax=Alcaligenes xylosoxydans xylosoxydans TaxID=85698 RepID=A0A424WKH5_ALCXX|nr:PepSY-associated TM helix domain-containing protein [Achromobacter xylosoxidans]MBC9903038.1 PepSY domain-containing protein [Achromobacter xylosoxidans]MBD0867628.1 PepSY domain-containing protein [Achromobacter xylosoxidans]QNP86889.1 PepSY domain-containing protein [Achromobacter xylosoxidans]RPJ93712.1 PepSY domain-containing protein [Achromobacter xylosoxidans]
MRADYIRIYKSVHTWTGILTGMALFIAFYAGALTVFKEPLTRWATPPAVVAPVPLEETPGLIARTLQARPDVAKGFSIHLQDAEHVPARMTWEVRDGQADDHDESSIRHHVAYLGAGGELRLEESAPSGLMSFIDVLHRVVGLPVDSDPNRWFMGIVASLYAIALVSGVIVLLPSLVKDFFALRVGKNLKRMWLDAHNVVGIVSLPFHIVMALSSVVFAFHDGIYDLQDKLMYEGKLESVFQRSGGGAPAGEARNPADMLTPAELLAQARDLAPGFEPYTLQYQQVTSPRAIVRVWGKDDSAVSPRARGGFVALDPYSGKVLNRDYLPGGQDAPNLWISSFFALHMASFGGAAVQWLYFLLGLAGAWLFYSGNLLWIETRRKRANRQTGEIPVQRLDTRLMASATVGVCLGCVCGISLMMVASKWLSGYVGDLNAWLRALYYVAFFVSLAWAFLRGGAAAGVHLLWVAAALTLTIPATSLVGGLFPASGLWAHTSAAALAVDATALAAGLGFAWMAKASARRIGRGDADSAWAPRRLAARER